jgi:2-polyprenyl-3-methyl-5-hydroxy-6-metoxy-1,4-benzoquinol methylase
MAATMQEAELYYDNFPEKLITDYIKGNPRIESAIQFALGALNDFGASRILDVGCGLGWSSHEFSKNIPNAFVQGVDLSGNLIEAAKTLFKADNLSYAKKDITEQDFSEHHQFDAVVMLDVYEHLPKTYRPFFHQSVKKVLAETGIMILTCPSVYLQQDSRENRPHLLQPVDEDVTQEDIEQLARDLDAEVQRFEYIKIWNTKDYFQTVIRRKRAVISTKTNISTGLEPKMERIIRIKNSKFNSILNTLNFSTRIRAAFSIFYPTLRMPDNARSV